ncbi:lytic transglycosylase domain-containing protein [Desulfoglaeba alkanexedens]|jgi:membrane-bound lytic murein transglycosylase D|nr:lytic transglycosylase domain-containing protein [Desulfoglaeba alkanexedens]
MTAALRSWVQRQLRRAALTANQRKILISLAFSALLGGLVSPPPVLAEDLLVARTVPIVSKEYFARPSHGDTLILASLPSTEPPPSVSKYRVTTDTSLVDAPWRPEIQRYVSIYKNRGRKGFQESLERCWAYLPIMAEILQRSGLPTELVYVPLVESSFRKKAESQKGAAGFWQLMPTTAQAMGLRVDGWVDERLDPIMATEAAARYLKLLYDRFGSWPLALAAYNAGSGTVRKAIRRHRTDDFWELSARGGLPPQTRAFVPKIFAAVLLGANLEGNGFSRPRYLPIFDHTTILVRKPLSLVQVAGWIEGSVSDLRALNPSLKRDRLPPKKGYRLRLPTWAVTKFLSAYESHLKERG